MKKYTLELDISEAQAIICSISEADKMNKKLLQGPKHKLLQQLQAHYTNLKKEA